METKGTFSFFWIKRLKPDEQVDIEAKLPSKFISFEMGNVISVQTLRKRR